jgi:hypothetical protein
VTPEQRDAAVAYLAEGSSLPETASLCGVPWPDFARSWTLGRSDAASGVESDEASWYVEADAARARFRANLRTRAAATAGARESSDLLALLRHLESEDEPVAEAATDVRGSSLFLDVSDNPERYSDETKRLVQESELALHDAWSAKINEDAARRRVEA